MATWPFWIGGVALLAAGLALLAWSMLGDRLRGGRQRRRCPRCWYEMTGVPGLTCPECGRAAGEERRLYRSRRRWRWAVAAAIVVLAGVSLVATPGVRRHGWGALLPTTAAIYILPWMGEHPKWYSDRLYRSIGTDSIPVWQRRLLFRRCEQVLRSNAGATQKIQALKAIESVAWRGGYYGRPTGEARDALPAARLGLADADPRVRTFAVSVVHVAAEPAAAVDEIARALASDSDPEVRARALFSLGQLWNHASPAAGAIAGAAASGSVNCGPALKLLGQLDPSTAAVTLPALIAALKHGETVCKQAAAEALWRLGPAAAEAAPSLVAALRDPGMSVRRNAATALETVGVASDDVLAGLAGLLDDEERYVRWAAARAMDVLARDRAEVVSQLRAWLAGREAEDAGGTVLAMGEGRRDVAPYADFLVPLLSLPGREAWGSRVGAARLLCICGYADSSALAAARALREDDIGLVRVWGEVLAAQLEGDRRRAVTGLMRLIDLSGGVSGDSNLRGEAAEALAMIGPGAEAALPHLEAMLAEEAWSPRENAKLAIHAITGESREGRLAPGYGPVR